MTYHMTRTTDLSAAAAAKGCRLVTPQPNELFIDVDSEDALARANELIRIYQQVFACSVSTTPSKTPGHYHIIVRLTDCEVDGPYDRVFLQVLLGSDQKRELLAYLQAEASGDQAPVSVFFEECGAEL